MGFELDPTALEGTEFLRNTNHVAQCHIPKDEDTTSLENANHMAQCHNPEDEGTMFFQNTNQMTQCHITKCADPLKSMC